MDIDIARLLESHRAHMLALVKEYVTEEEMYNSEFAIQVAHDRATTKTLLDLYRKENTAGTAAPAQHPPVAAMEPPVRSRQIKPGSKRAKDRAAKAVATKQRKAADAANHKDADAAHRDSEAHGRDTAELSPATHLAPVAVRNAGGDGDAA